MTYLHSVPSDLDYAAFQPPRYGAPVALHRPAAARIRTQVGTVLYAAVGLIVSLFRSWRQAVEARRARHRLMQLDDHFLRDIGLSRPDVCFSDFEELGGHRRAGGIG